VKFLIALLLFGPGWSLPERIAELADPAIDESSGIAASWRNRGLYWTHNDSGNPPDIYLFDPSGHSRGTWHVAGAQNRDWEDIAIGPGPVAARSYLYIGDIGDNGVRRKEIAIYRVPEPAAGSGGVATTERAVKIRLRYPDGPHDAEALVVHPRTGDIHVIIKAHGGGETVVYRASGKQPAGTITTMLRLGRLQLPHEFDLSFLLGGITGGSVSRDGRRVVLCDYFRAYEAVLPAGHAFQDVWSQPWRVINVGIRRQGEGICYRLDGKALLLTSEGRPCPLYQSLLTP
jgi:hypothetical protein